MTAKIRPLGRYLKAPGGVQMFVAAGIPDEALLALREGLEKRLAMLRAGIDPDAERFSASNDETLGNDSPDEAS